ncbi:MAG: hypothetical protein ABEJ97_06485 [Halobellus sp.]
MSDQSDTELEEEQESEQAGASAQETASEEEVVVDLDSAEEYQTRIEELEETVEAQREEIEELQDLMVDLSARVADGRGFGVCPECHGPVRKVRRWLGATTIECARCGEVYHEY